MKSFLNMLYPFEGGKSQNEKGGTCSDINLICGYDTERLRLQYHAAAGGEGL